MSMPKIDTAHRWVVKLMVYEEAATVPFIVSWKSVTPEGVVDGVYLASGLDVLLRLNNNLIRFLN